MQRLPQHGYNTRAHLHFHLTSTDTSNTTLRRKHLQFIVAAPKQSVSNNSSSSSSNNNSMSSFGEHRRRQRNQANTNLTTGGGLSPEAEQELFEAMKSKLVIADEPMEEYHSTTPVSETFSTIESIVRHDGGGKKNKKKKKAKKTFDQGVAEELKKVSEVEEFGVRGYAYRFGVIKELQELEESGKWSPSGKLSSASSSKAVKSSSGSKAAAAAAGNHHHQKQWRTIKLKATPIKGATSSASTSAQPHFFLAAGSSSFSLESSAGSSLSSSTLPPPTPPPRSTSLKMKLSDYHFELGDDHDRLVDYHYRDFVDHYGDQLFDSEEEQEYAEYPNVAGKDDDDDAADHHRQLQKKKMMVDIRAQMETSVLQLKCMEAALPPEQFQAVCRLMEQYRGGEVDLATFQRRQEEIFAEQKAAGSTLKHFFPLCRKLTLSIPKKVRFFKSCTSSSSSSAAEAAGKFASASVDEEADDDACKEVGGEEKKATNEGGEDDWAMTPVGKILLSPGIQQLITGSSFSGGGHPEDEEEDDDFKLGLLPPPPPPPTSTPPLFGDDPRDVVPRVDFHSETFFMIVRSLVAVKERKPKLFLTLMDIILQALLTGQPHSYRFYEELALQVIAALKPHLTLFEDEEILQWLMKKKFL